ncbi:MAG: hypothetical protein M0D57_10405 [Sphingobacteriales bacterium JAD_PAG50586_3]|nr:MAG: hypothetical protein M0D57_10405 [Sphingobacteriales bacterium JAD_PAG50586_3]
MAYNYADTYTGNATFNKNSTGDITLSINGNTTFKGDATLVSSSAASFATGNIIFNGSNNQTLTKTGSGTLSFGRLTINKASNNLTLSSPLTVSTALTLTSGKIITTGTNILNLADNATVSGASNSSYVQGPMKKTGNDAFTFPTGKNNYYRPIGIAAPTIAATVFTAEYLDANQTLGTTADTSIANLSDCEHWTLTRSGSSDNVNVTLSWNSTSCNGALASNMRVAGWNGSLWTNYGNGSRTGTSIAGTVTTGTTPTAFNAFTLGNKNCTGVATITPSGATSFCSGNNITLSTPAGAKKYTWLPSGFTNSITVSTSNEYFVKVVDSLGCTGKDSVDVNVWANPTINAGTDTVIIAGDTIQLNATAGGGATPYTYEWTPSTGLSSTTVANPFVYPDTLSNYIVKVTDTNGCINRDTLKVWVGILNFTLSTDTANIGDSVFIFINCSGFPSDTLKLFFGDFCDEYSNLNYQACNQQTLMVDTLLKKYYVKGDLLVQLSYKTLFKVKPISILGNCTNCPFPICDLVCNGDFETTTSSFFGGINCASANNIDLACPWTDDGENATADHYNTAYADDSNGRDFHPPATVFSNSMGFNGSNGYAGIATFTNPPNNTIMPVREYIREPLIEPLVPGIQYKCSMQIKRSAPNSNDCNNKIFNQFATEIGFVLSENATDFNFGTGTSSGKLVPINNFHQKTTGIITDDNNWTNVELTFTNSFSNISWITIGRFGNVNDNSPQPTNLGFTLDPDNRVQAYYLIDNVSIVPILDEVNPLSVDNQTPCVNEEITLTVDDGFTVIAWVINGVPNYFIPTTNVINYTIPESANDTFTIGVSLELHGCEFYKEVAIYPNAMCCPGTVDIRNLLYPVNKITSATVLANASGYYDDYLIPSTNQFSTGYNRCGFGTAFTLALSGTFEIDQDFEFSYADVILAKDAKIIVKPGKTLTITNSHLHACSGFMWKSIIVENGGNLIIQGSGTNPACGTLIQDAEVAIDYWGNSNFDIITSEFDNNYRHVQIRDFTGAHNFFASNSTFHKTGNLLLPYSSLTRSMSCINIPLSTATAASIMIGDPSDIDNQNYFADAQYGIIGRDVSVTSQNNMFENIKGNITTAAIYTYPRFKTNYSLTVGNTNPATRYKNIFTDCTNGIRAFSRLDANIHRNDFTNIQRVGINIYNAAKIPPAGSLLNITYNDMTTVRTGILLNNIRPISSVVNYNSIDNTAIDLGIGISQSEGWTAKGTFEINENTITGVSHGIIARGLTEAVGNFNVDGFECIGNNVTVTSANSDYPIGISALQCPDVLIRQNNVFGDDQNWDGGSGIEVDLCNNADVFCNSVEDIGRSFWFERNNFPTRFAGNRMENGESAVVLIDNAICGQQAPAGQFNWNQFFGPYDFSFNVFNSDGVTAMSKFVIWNTISEFSPAFFDTQRRFPLSPLPNPVISNDISESFIFPIEPPLPNYVDDCFDNILPTHLLWAKVMIADSSSRYDTLNSKWRNWKYLYEYIKGDSILSVSTDTVITNFLDSMENHSIGDLHIVNSLIQVDSILDADDLNKLLATTTDMEYLQKSFING